MAQKHFREYIDAAPDWWESSLDDYSRRPAVAFLREAVHISDAINQCRRRFQRKGNNELNKDSQDSIYRLGAAALSAIMGHLETYQRSLFAGMIETTRLIPSFDIEKCCQRLQKDASLSIDLARISAYRGQPTPIGQLMADNLVGWHDPEQVNSHFSAMVSDFQFISKSDGEQLRILWQLRHSVVHTGGWLTQPDAQKVPSLTVITDHPILFNEKFIETAARRLHRIVARSTKGIGKKFQSRLPAGLEVNEKKVVSDLFLVESPRPAWLN